MNNRYQSILTFFGLIRLYFFNTCLNKIPFDFIRLCFVKQLVTLGKDSNLCTNVKILYPGWNKQRIKIGDNCAISPECILDGRYGEITIKNNVDISRGTWIFTLEHDPHSDFHDVKSGNVLIEDDVWVASRVTIMPGVCIGKGSVIASGAVVTKDIPPMCIAGGVPAKVIGERRSELKYKIKYFPFLHV